MQNVLFTKAELFLEKLNVEQATSCSNLQLSILFTC